MLAFAELCGNEARAVELDSGRWEQFTALLIIGALRELAALEQRPYNSPD